MSTYHIQSLLVRKLLAKTRDSFQKNMAGHGWLTSFGKMTYISYLTMLNTEKPTTGVTVTQKENQIITYP